MSPESFERVLKINLEGPFFLTQAAAGRIIANRNGKFHCIVNIGSVSADYASINRGEYCLSKAGVAMATKLWAARLAEEGIAVYEIQPGVIKSDMTACVTEKYDKMIAEGLTLQKRWGFPEDIGKAVLMLVSGSLAYSTGQVIHVDGGLTVLRF
jgi:NAD(P)-dependent dehydrogenase (short-subunit alcohol dehydrogenase family)